MVGCCRVTNGLVGVGPELSGGRAILYGPAKDDSHETVLLETSIVRLPTGAGKQSR